jgi:hypothetical protein
MDNKNIWQVVSIDRQGRESLQSWHESKEAAELVLKECERMWPDCEFYLEQGTDHIRTKCRHCGDVNAEERFDHYSITTGYWCDSCYDSKAYPYRKDAYYDPSYANERLEEDY